MVTADKELCLSLLYAESEREVIEHLKAARYWDDDSAWRNFGGIENNWAQIGIQQAHPVAAMVEKLVNSIDAVLMRECQERGIPLESPDAPQSIDQALEQFFDIKNGNLANIGATRRTELAQNIGFIATGPKGREKRNPNYTIFDIGEGQTPNDMPKTFLSLFKSNKLRIPFVQGKFNMGGTGVLRHGGRNRLQLIVSRRNPEIADTHDPTSPYWGITVVRRQDITNGARNSVYAYLAPHGRILNFDCEALRMPSNEKYIERAPSIEWGTAIKLYEYKMKGLATDIKRDLYYEISRKLPKPGLPIRFFEFRAYPQDSPELTMAGLHVRLKDDKGNNLEDNCPSSYPVTVEGEPLKVDIYVFKKDSRDSRYRKGDGIIFTINGQSHGVLSKRFFSRKSVRMDYLKDSILVIADASGFSTLAREDLFMNSRDRLSEGELRDAVEDELERVIREDPLLRELREKRRREALDAIVSDKKPLKDALEKVIKNSPSLAALFITGKDLGNPFKSVAASISKDPYTGSYFPTYLDLMKKHEKRNERPINRKRIQFQFETDAQNDYFTRELDHCISELYCNGHPVSNFTPKLLNGVVTLNIKLPEDVKVGDALNYEWRVSDDTRIEPFLNTFEVRVTDPVTNSRSEPSERKQKVNKGNGDRTLPENLEIPDPNEVFQQEWAIHGFNRESALSVKAAEESYDFFINMDNIYLKTELKSLKSTADPTLLNHRFKFAMALLGMMILKDSPSSQEKGLLEDYDITQTELVAKVTSMVAPVILPMIDSLGDLELD